MADISLTVEQVQNMDVNDLCDTLDNMEVDYSLLENIEDLRDLVMHSITSRNSSDTNNPSQEQASSDIMGRILERDAEIRRIIADVYDSILTMLKMDNFERNLSSEMKKEYDDYVATVKSFRQQISRKHCPIVVAGETGAGKSSLLNLILGEHVLPRQVLSCTSTICQIFNSDKKKAVAIDENDEVIPLQDVTEATLSQFVSVDRSGINTAKYKRVDIYWPLPMLKEHATLVDTPGIGESEEMTNKLMNYLSEAVAFIYVINTTNAGGVQDDRLVKLLKKQYELQRKGRMHEFDPESAIFVCNKWDQVPTAEQDKVWEYNVQKLGTSWPTRRNINIANQMFKMSVKEDIRRKETGLGYTEKFRYLMSGIDRLISASLERRVKRHAEWQQTFLDRVLIKIVAKINASKKNQEEKIVIKTEVEKRLKTLQNETENIKKTMEERAKQECQAIADALAKQLNDDKTKARIFQWQAELPDDDDFEIIQYRAKQLIRDKIETEIVHWCMKNHIKERFSGLFDRFIEECKLIKSNYREIDKIIQGTKPPISDSSQEAEVSSDSDSCQSDSIFSLTEKIAIVVLSPVWVPILVPIAVGMVIKDSVKEKWKINHFKRNKMAHMLNFAEREMIYYSSKSLNEGLQEMYLRDFMSSLEHVCDNIIPKQIKADQELIENIVKENRDSQTLKQEYTPIEKSCKEIIGNLLYAKLSLFSNQPCIEREIAQLGRGSFSTVSLCDAQIDDRVIRCAVKKMTSPLRHEVYIQLTEVVNMMTFRHPNIVQCYGISVDKTICQREYLNIFMELCECSLEDIILCDGHPMEMCQCSRLRRKTCHVFHEKDRNQHGYMEAWVFFMNMLEDIVSGLLYLHEKGFVHRDIKPSNILVKENSAKIADVGLSKFENLLQGTITGTPVFMAPEVFEGRMYGRSADIFSLAIMMWEMWYGRRVFSESVYSDVITSYHSIKEHVMGGARPKFSDKTPPPEEIRTLMSDCWTEVADDRPTARELRMRLRNIAAILS